MQVTGPLPKLSECSTANWLMRKKKKKEAQSCKIIKLKDPEAEGAFILPLRGDWSLSPQIPERDEEQNFYLSDKEDNFHLKSLFTFCSKEIRLRISLHQ